VLAEPPPAEQPLEAVGVEQPSGSAPIPLVLSARSEPALRAQAGRLRDWLTERPGLEPAEVAASLVGSRTLFDTRAVVLGSGREELLQRLGALAAGEISEGVVSGRAREGGTAFVFPGQGSQWQGMGLELIESSEVFAASIRECGEALSAYVDWSLEDVLRGAEGAPGLDRVDVVQPALFAVMVSLAALWRSHGVEPTAVVGHSQGEIAAAYVAGALSLDDAARVVCLRSQAVLEGLAGQGGMASLALTPEQAAERIEPYGERISLAALNGPASVVVAGEVPALEELLAACESEGIWARRIPVDYPSHTAAVEALRERLAEDLAPISPQASEIPFFSTLEARQIDTAELDAGYWYRSLRNPVRFAEAIAALVEAGTATFVEASPNPGLTIAIASTAEAAETAGSVSAIGSLQREDGGLERFLASLAKAHASGVAVDWETVLPGGGRSRVPLPTYAFQRERYWLAPHRGALDLAQAGLSAVEHPLLQAGQRVAGTDQWLFSGQLSLEAQTWLGDHAVMETPIFPGTGFLELALAAAERVGAGGVEDLTLVAPLVLDTERAVQVAVADADEEGRRAVNVYSRPQGAAEEDDDATGWTLHASGLLAAAEAPLDDGLREFAAASWPPEAAEEIAVEDFYDTCLAAGYDYGPAFQGVRRAFRDRDALYVEVALEEEQRGPAGEFCVHPALSDAAVHATLLDLFDRRGPDAPPEVPFSFSSVRLERQGAPVLRVRLEVSVDADVTTAGLLATDEAGEPVLAVEAIRTRPVDQALLRAQAGAGREGLMRVEWIEVEAGSDDDSTVRGVLIGSEDADPGAPGIELDAFPDLDALEVAVAEGLPVPEVVLAWPEASEAGAGLVAAAHGAAERTLALLQDWLAREPLGQSRLVLLTEGALAVREGESPDLGQATLAGLLRSAHSENPGRVGLVDLDGGTASTASLAGALAAEEPELALRDGELLAPRLARVELGDAGENKDLDPEGTVLITGGTGGLGALVARHLAEEHGARRVLLTSRSGGEAPAAQELIAALAELGCEAEVAACDVADREQLRAVLERIPAEYPLTAVVHAAGVLDDGIVDSLDGERLRRVMGPKVEGAVNLHELTGGAELAQFVLFSSAASTLGNPGQGNYAAANAFLDALAHRRHADGLPAVSVAWGAWELATGMTAETSEADRARLRRSGVAELSEEEGLALLDAVRDGTHPLFVAARLDTAGLRAQARAGALPAILRGLVRAPARSRAAEGSLARRLAGVQESERQALVLDLVRGHVATVLGHGSAEQIDHQRAFKELGFDSLGAVELRNRLTQSSGLHLPSTLVFDHPTPAAVAAHLVSIVEGVERAAPAVSASLRRSEEPIAIVGMSARFPGGADSPAELWRLVAEGTDAIGEFPADRGWDLERLYDPDPDAAGTCYARGGGFLHDAGEFDADFFSISPREALALDPQHRLALEGAWEALEDAGIDPQGLEGSQTGVFAGVMYQDYGAAGVPAELEGYLGTGGSLLSGRLAYTLGLEGPAVSVDTACSSSLVAIHQACQALRDGECELALAGGVALMATPTGFIQFSRQRALSADGRCRAFGAEADGVGWAEGAGLLVLERLSEARQQGHRVLATIRGSAVNQDGASNGLTAPNGPSQERVIRQALAAAGLSAADVDAVEGHGTGTTLGDPIEAQALLATYGQERDNGPLHLGSIKSNIGHTQAAAGVAGVIKMVEAMRRGVLPRSLHCEEPSPHVDWSAGEVELLHEPVEWPAGERVRRAGVSSFGISGTNAHLILEEAPAAGEPVADRVELPALPLVLSAHNEEALLDQAERLRERMAGHPELEPADVSFTLATARARLGHRAAVVGADREELLDGLASLAGGEPGGAAAGQAGDGKTAFLFTGQGAQRAGMGRELAEAFPAFAQALDEVISALDEHLERPLKELMFAEPDSEDAALLDRTENAQPALFAIEVALFRLLETWGVSPDYLVGHSIGELSAAHVAGVLTLPDACALVAARGRLMGALPEGGGMLAIRASEPEVAKTLSGFEDRVSIAAVNGPQAVVVSGEDSALDEIEALWTERGADTKQVRVSHAFHSPLMEPMLEEFREVAAGLAFAEPRIEIVSNLSGQLASANELTDPNHWVAHVREAVRFADGIGELDRLGVNRFLELGPDGVLTAMAEIALGEESPEGALFAPSLRAGGDEPATLTTFLAAAHNAGVEVDWSSFFGGTGAQLADLPTYAFQRQRYWLASSGAGDLATAGQASAEHPLLGAAVELAGGEGWLFTGRLSLQGHPWLADHAVMGTAILPGTAFLDLALVAAEHAGAGGLNDLTLVAPLVLEGERDIQVAVAEADEEGRRAVSVYSRPRGVAEDSGGGWTLHASGLLAAAEAGDADGDLGALADAEWPPADAEELDTEDLYERLAAAGYDYGPAFQGLRRAFRAGDSIYAEVALEDDGGKGHRLHPALADAALHALLLERGEDAATEVPFSFSGVRLQGRGAAALRVQLERSGEGTTASLRAVDETGAPAIAIGSIDFRALDEGALRSQTAGGSQSLFSVEWVEGPAAPGDAAPHAAVVGDAAPFGSDFDVHPDLAALEQAIAEGKPAPEVVVARPPAPDADAGLADAVHEAAAGTLSLLQGFLASEPLAGSRLVLLTEGALAVGGDESPDLAQAALAGLMRSAHSENPGRVALVDLDVSDASAAALAGALAGDEPELALREGALLVPRLTRAKLEDDPAGEPLDPEGTVLVTGGTGGLGALVARHLAEEHGARRLLLASRSGIDAEGATELIAVLAELGCEAEVAACDVADREQLRAVLERIPAEHPLAVVVHTAGVIDDGVVDSLDGERLRSVMTPKVDGAINLHELTKDSDLAQFVLFSSIASTLGNPGQANYAAANAFLDVLAQQRHADGLPATALAWGAWQLSTGMTAEASEADRARLRRSGVAELSAEEGLALFDAARDGARPLLAVARLDTAALRAQARAGTLAPVLRGLVRVPVRSRAAEGSLARRLAAAPEAEWQAIVLELMCSQVASILGHGSAEAIDPRRTFKELGFDSLSAVELRNRLTQSTGLQLPSTLVFDHPTPGAAVEYLRSIVAETEQAAPAVRRAAPRSEEPIAIVGMSARYPGGARSPEELWQLVASGADAIGEFPTDRGWDLERLYNPDPDHPGTSYTRHGGFLYEAGEFDPGFFLISPREAQALDPQHRLALEGAWEALEDAGIDPHSLKGSQTGVFAGVMYQDYGAAGVPPELEGFLGTGGSLLSGRLAYTLGLEGPAVAVDTACSSSLVAIHQACQALREGECGLALAGGVTVMARPTGFIQFSRQRALSPDGHCRSYGAGADGVGWGEGAGLLVLERLADARANGHEVLAVVRGSAVNQDGASNGLTAPNGPSQERVIRQALASAGLAPADVDAVEGHGTGTTLGDPIEAQALLSTYGQERESGPLRLGSIKSNIGHTQAAAGVAGVIKMVQAMRHGVLPRSLHCEEPSPHIDWSAGEVELLSEPVEWPAGERIRRAGVSSFGVSGTNAHLILEEAPRSEGEAPAKRVAPPALPLLVSAHGEEALRDQAERLREWIVERPELDPADVAFTLARGRARLEHRAAVVGADREELVERLGALAAGEPGAGVLDGEPREGRTAFMFTGQGAQRAGMGRELAEAFPAFAAALEEVCAVLDEHLDRPLQELLFAEPDSKEAELLDRTEHAQPALFALEVALFRLLESWGVRPDYLIGHSIGELTAAHVAGALTLPDACALVAARGRLMGALPGGGGMLAIRAGEDEVAESLNGFEEKLSIAAVNGPRAIVVSGEGDALDEIEALWSGRGTDTKRLRVSHAFHSPLMDPMLEEFREVAEGIDYGEPRIEIVSNRGGEVVAEELRDPGHWVAHVREAVRFADGVAELGRLGVSRFLELGPDGVLTAMAELARDEEPGAGALFAPALRAGAEEPQALVAFLAAADNSGVDVDWGAFFAGSGARLADLPTFAFQRQQYWLAPHHATPDLSRAGLSALEHPLLQAALPLPGGAAALTGLISLARQPWLRDHAVFDRVVVPATAYTELLLAASRQTGGGIVEELTIEAPLVLAEDDEVSLQVVVGEADGEGRREVELYSRGPAEAGSNGDGPEWVRHASGILAAEESTVGAALQGLAAESWPPAGAEPVDVDSLYDRLADAGFGYGPAFQGLTSAWRRGAETFCEVALAADLMAGGAGFGVHPALLDSTFHAAIEGLSAASGGDTLPLPFASSGVRLHRAGAPLLRVRLELAGDGGAVSLAAVDANAEPVIEIESLVVRPVDASRLGAASHLGRDTLLEPRWVPLALDDDAQPSARCAVLGAGVGPVGDAPVHGDLEALVAAIGRGEKPPEIVLASVPAPSARAGTSRLLSLLQAWLGAEECEGWRLVLLTRGATVVADGEAPDPDQAALWGLVRSAQFEHPDRLLLVDLDEAADVGEIPWPALVATEEQQLAVRRGGVYALRLTRLQAGPALVPPPGEDRWHVDAPRRGTLDDLALVESTRAKKPIGPAEVRVAVRAAGVNFRDVLIALGHYKDDDPIGGEGAGVVLEVGEAVSDLTPGDRILGPIVGAFGPVAVTDRRLIAKFPDTWSFAQAASVPIAFSTAYHGLFDLGGLGEGQTVLIHAGAGAVGMAAIQLARRAGAEVFATASPGKWHALRDLGLDEDHIASSRDLDYRERFLAATDGRGVDLVLNSLAHEFVDASLDLLPRGGRFVEMGKSDIRDAEEVARDHEGVHYRAFDLVPSAGPDRVGEILAEVVASFEAGTLRPIPFRAWDVRHAPEAFRHLGDGRNVGKVVLAVPRPLDPEGTVLITGGTGDLGARVARHLAREHGVRRLLLASRRGIEAPGAAELVEELRGLGAEPSVAACDAADRDDVAALLAAVDPEHPLTAVVHTAGVLDDGVVESLTEAQVERVLRPKVDAALLLDELTRGGELAEFVLFSSQSGLMGSPGQGNYAAANVFLDALAERRRAQGLPAKSLAWGLWSEATGMGQLGEDDVARLARVGAAPMRNELELLDAARASAATVVVPTRLDAAALRAAAEAGILPRLLRDLVRERAGREREAARPLGERLAAVPADEHEDVVLDAVSEQVAAVLGFESAEAIDPERDFKELGFDSLGAVELRNRLARVTGGRLPSTLVFDHPSPLALTHFLLARLVSPANGDGAADAEEAGSAPVSEACAVDDLDADELVRLAKEAS